MPNRAGRRAQPQRKEKLSARAQLARAQAQQSHLLGQVQALTGQLDVQRRHVLRLTQALGGLYVPALALRDALVEAGSVRATDNHGGDEAINAAAGPFVASIDAWLQRPQAQEVEFTQEEPAPAEPQPSLEFFEAGGSPEFVGMPAQGAEPYEGGPLEAGEPEGTEEAADDSVEAEDSDGSYN